MTFHGRNRFVHRPTVSVKSWDFARRTVIVERRLGFLGFEDRCGKMRRKEA